MNSQHDSLANCADHQKQDQQNHQQQQQQPVATASFSSFSSTLTTKLTIVLGNVAAANELIHRSSLFLPLEDHLDLEDNSNENHQHYKTGCTLASTFSTGPLVELPSDGDDVRQLQHLAQALHWLTSTLPLISDLTVSVSLSGLDEHATASTVDQTVRLLACWAPTLKCLRLWLGSEGRSTLKPIWSAVNQLPQLRSLSVDMQEFTRVATRLGWRELEEVEELTALGQLQQFSFASRNVCIWKQLLSQPSTASLAILSETSVETLLALSPETTARLTAINIGHLASTDQLTALFGSSSQEMSSSENEESGNGGDGNAAAAGVEARAEVVESVAKFSRLRRLVITIGQTVTFLEVLKSLGASRTCGLQSLSIRLAFTGSLWSKKERMQQQSFNSAIDPSMAASLSTISSLSIETEWLFDHGPDMDLSPLPRLFPALQTFTLSVRMSLCGGCPTALACAGALLYPISAGKCIRRMSITLGPDRPPMEFATHHH